MKATYFIERFVVCVLTVSLLGMGWRSSPVSATDVKNQFWRVELWTDQEVVQPGGVVRYYIRITRLGPPVPEATIEFRTSGAFERLTDFSIPPTSLIRTDSGWIARWEVRTGTSGVQFASKRGLPPYVLAVFDAWMNPSAPPNGGVMCQLSASSDTDQTTTTNQVVRGGTPNLTNGATGDNSANSAEPVQLGTGEYFTDPVVDINLGGPLPLFFSRRYAARLQDEGTVGSALGENWLHNFDLRVNPTSSGLEVIYYGEKSSGLFPTPIRLACGRPIPCTRSIARCGRRRPVTRSWTHCGTESFASTGKLVNSSPCRIATATR